MVKRVVLVMIVLCALSFGEETLRIFDGRNAKEAEFPFVVAILNENDEVICTGTILNNLTVLTACHCITTEVVVSKNPDFYVDDHSTAKVVAGRYFTENQQGSQVRRISSWWHHPDCKYLLGYGYSHNLAIIRVTDPFEFGRYVQPVSFVNDTNTFLRKFGLNEKPPYNPTDIANCYSVGWGISGTTYREEEKYAELSYSKYLQVLELDATLERGDIISNCFDMICLFTYEIKNCNKEKMMKSFVEGSYDHFCGVATNSGTTCLGDSGGPLVCNKIMYGVNSYEFSCGILMRTKLFARVDIESNFIIKSMNRSHKSWFVEMFYILSVVHLVKILMRENT